MEGAALLVALGAARKLGHRVWFTGAETPTLLPLTEHGDCTCCSCSRNKYGRQRRWDSREQAHHEALPSSQPQIVLRRSAALDEAGRSTQDDPDRNGRCPTNPPGGYCSPEEHRVDSNNGNGHRRVDAYGCHHGSRRIPSGDLAAASAAARASRAWVRPPAPAPRAPSGTWGDHAAAHLVTTPWRAQAEPLPCDWVRTASLHNHASSNLGSVPVGELRVGGRHDEGKRAVHPAVTARRSRKRRSRRPDPRAAAVGLSPRVLMKL